MRTTARSLTALALAGAFTLTAPPAHAEDVSPSIDTGAAPAACDARVMMGVANPPTCLVNNLPDAVEVKVGADVVHEGEIFTVEVNDRREDPDDYFPTSFGWDLELFYPWGKDFGAPGWYPQGAPAIREPRSFAHPTRSGTFRKLSPCLASDRTCTWQVVMAPAIALSPGQPVPPSVTVPWSYMGVRLDGPAQVVAGAKWAEAPVAVAPVFDHLPTAAFTVRAAGNGDPWSITVDGTPSTDEDGPIRNYVFNIDGVEVISPVATVSIPHDPTETSREIQITLGVDAQRFSDYETQTIRVPLGPPPAPAGYMVELPPVGGEDIDPVLDDDGTFVGFGCGSLGACPKGLTSVFAKMPLAQMIPMGLEQVAAVNSAALTGGIASVFADGWKQGALTGAGISSIPAGITEALAGFDRNWGSFVRGVENLSLPPGSSDGLVEVTPDGARAAALAGQLANAFTNLETIMQTYEGMVAVTSSLTTAVTPPATPVTAVTVVDVPRTQGNDIDPVLDGSRRVVGFRCGLTGMGSCPAPIGALLSSVDIRQGIVVAGQSIAAFNTGSMVGQLRATFNQGMTGGQLFDGLNGKGGGVPAKLDAMQAALAKMVADAQALPVKPPAPGTAPLFTPKPAPAATLGADVAKVMTATQDLTQMMSGLQATMQGFQRLFTPPTAP